MAADLLQDHKNNDFTGGARRNFASGLHRWGNSQAGKDLDEGLGILESVNV